MKLRPGCPPIIPMVLLLSTLALWPALTLAQSIADDRAALQGIKEVKVAFDITAGDAKALLARLNVIDETRQSLIKQILSRPARQS